jgi:hypothetical protein
MAVTNDTLTTPDKEMIAQGTPDNIIPLPEEDTPTPEPEVEDDEDLKLILFEMFQAAEKEDEDLRYRLIQIWKRNDYYFNNIQNIFFDAVARDYRTIDSAVAEMVKMGDVDDIKTINIYRAFAESIISALSVQPPNINYTPDDADEPEDRETADAYTKISELVGMHNNANLMLIKALTILFNCGVIAGHNYYKTDPKYGTIQVPKTTQQIEKHLIDLVCPECSQIIEEDLPGPLTGNESANVTCPQCKYQGAPEPIPHVEQVNEVTDYENTPKGRSGFDIFGPTYVKLPLYARRQENCGYLILRLEEHVSKFRQVYDNSEIRSGGGDTYLYERWGRIPPEYYGTLPTNLTTARYGWFRPSWYYHPDLNEDKTAILKQKFPNGVKVTVIDQEVMEYENGDLDDEWTISFDPRANFIHAEPAGNSLVPVQDAKNDTFNLGLQSIEYGIPETFAHPKTLNFQKYNQTRATPGMVTPAMPPAPDKNLSDGFYSLKTATLSNEYIEFDKSLDQIGQFVSAAMPGIWGGALKSGETTASEASDSRSMALQRLQITWQMVSVFWPTMIHKCATDFARNLREDERYTKKQNGTAINVWIRKSSLAGKVGEVQPELSGQLPQTWAQKKAFIMQLVQLLPTSPQVAAILLHPSNLEILKETVGMPEFYVPGEHDRNKQYQEFYFMSNGKPAPIDLDVDDHEVHKQVLKTILVSPVGVSLYTDNPQAYQMCIEHYRQHELAEQAHTMAASGKTGVGEPPDTSAESSAA